MFRSMTFEVRFHVVLETGANETVCVVGDCPELGNWNPYKARQLKRRAQDSRGHIWSRDIQLTTDHDVKYRYFVCEIIHADSEEEESSFIVKKWETNKHPRKLSPKAYLTNPKGCDTTEAIFGSYGGKESLDKGWLTDQAEIQLRFHSNPIQMWKLGHRNQSYRLRVNTLDLKNKHMHSGSENGFDGFDEDTQDAVKPTGFRQIQVSVLSDNKQSSSSTEACPQHQFGELYEDGSYMVFKAQTLDVEGVGFQVELYVTRPSASANDVPKHIGYAYLLHSKMKDSQGVTSVPIMGLKHTPLGQLTIDYLIVKSMRTHQCDLAVSYAKHWKKGQRTLDVGHRGMGTSYSATPTKLASVRENTLASFSQAAHHGADCVEFDVHLTKDLIPIVYHDFKVCLTLRKRKKEELEYFEIPVKDLTLADLQKLKLDHVTEKVTQSRDISAEYIEPEELEPCPTLKDVLGKINPNLAFNIEIKFPMQLKNGDWEEHMDIQYFDINMYTDIVLSTILRYGGDRRIFLSSFHADICVACRLKQNKYPVQFLTQGNALEWPPYMDTRSRSTRVAAYLAASEQFLGINPNIEDLLRDAALLREILDSGLVMFAWGTELNDQSVIRSLKKQGVQGLIYDRISEFKTTAEEVFNMEDDAKLILLQDLGAQPVPNPATATNGADPTARLATSSSDGQNSSPGTSNGR